MQRIRVEAGFAEIVGHGVLWLVLIVITLGLAGLVWPYYAFQFVLSRTVVETSEGDMRFVVEGSFPGYLGHAVLWALGMLVTLGLATPLWIYDVYRHVLARTKLVPA